jgi:hypothetical protein
MASSSGSGTGGVPAFHVHPGHAFAGFELVNGTDGISVLVARCDCGEVLDVADAQFMECPDCSGQDAGCMRCGGSRQVVDHAALQWRPRDSS